MTNTITNYTPTNVRRYSQLPHWIVYTALASILTIVLHEVAHYSTARLLGASDVTFHWAYVGHDTSSLSALGNAAVAFAGPLSSYTMALFAWLYSRYSVTPFVLGFGFSSAFRNFAVLPFTIKTILGRDTSTFFFDEVRGASALGISTMGPALVSLAVAVIGTVYFGRKAQQAGTAWFTVLLIGGSLLGVYVWTLIGPLIFPGGYGIN